MMLDRQIMEIIPDISIASITLDSSTCADIICGSNGLPLTPNSIRIIGDFKARVENVDHPCLVKYVECFRNKNERVTLIFENLPSRIPTLLDWKKIANQFLDALGHLHNSINCVHGLITIDCLVWSGDDLKLADWPINLLTNGGIALGAMTILPSDLSFIAPEQVKEPKHQATSNSDIWSAGLTLLKLIKPAIKLFDNPCRLAFLETPDQVLDQIDGHLDEHIISDSDKWNEFFKAILHPDPNLRGSLEDLYTILDLEMPKSIEQPLLVPIEVDQFETKQKSITELSISEIYYLWRLSIGRNIEMKQKQDDCPPIFKIPYLIVIEKQISPPTNELNLKNHIIIDSRPKIIKLDKFKEDLRSLDPKMMYPLILTDEELLMSELNKSSNTFGRSINIRKETNNNNTVKRVILSATFADLDDLSENSNIQTQLNKTSKILPIVIKEADFAYQCERIVLYKRLLSCCPFLKDQLRLEASVDIPPYFRAQTWAVLLNVSADKCKHLYETIDKTIPIATDRQISVDIPRCHQYNELMASPQGHMKLARVLKTWLNYNSAECVYWQGLDSLAAPFLLLNFDNEHLAFGCFNAFVNKYLRGFFRKDNQLIVQQYLSMFSKLLSYHDPSLAIHLDKLGFLPNLYAIPWFLTMFTHVLPLHKILHVWDCLLLGDEKFPLCIGLAILSQLRPELMDYNFNDCIVAFSDLPEINIERCIKDASHFYNSTPDKLINIADIRDSADIKDPEENIY